MQSRIMLVDDDHAFLAFIAAIVRNRYPTAQVDEMADGWLAWTMATRGAPPAIVITDIAMPRLDGNELCKMLRKRFHNRVKIIALTATRLSADADFDLILSKPFSIDALFTAIDAIKLKK